MSLRAVRTSALAALSGALVSTNAWSAPSPRDVSDAEQDFAKARQLMSEGRDLDQACALFAESNRLDPGTGTLLNLAICHEKVGKIASAWSDYNDVLAQSRQENRADRVDVAQKKLNELLPRLSSLAFVVPAGSAPPGLTLSVDGRDRDPSLWSVEKYIDPGAHEIKATAPNKRPWTTTVTVDRDHEELRVSVPALDDAPSTLAAAPGAAGRPNASTEAPQEARPGRAAAGWVVGGVGVASLAVGAIFGVAALSKNSDSKSACAAGCVKDTAYSSANRDAWAADVAIPVGVVAVGIGAYLVLTSRGDSDRAPSRTASRLVPIVNVGRGGGFFGLNQTF